MRDLSDFAHGGPRDWGVTARSYMPEMKTQGHGYRADLELSDRSRG